MTALWPTQTGLISVSEAEARLTEARALGSDILNRDFVVRLAENRLELARQRARHKQRDNGLITDRSKPVPARPVR